MSTAQGLRAVVRYAMKGALGVGVTFSPTNKQRGGVTEDELLVEWRGFQIRRNTPESIQNRTHA